MNYVNHLNGFFNKAYADKRMKPNHISLYLMLFNNWNTNRFNNPTSIPKEKIMMSCKIRSNTTYYKCMKELEAYGFIEHLPTNNPHMNSNVTMIDFSESGKAGIKFIQVNFSKFEQDDTNNTSKNSYATEHVDELANIIYNNKTKINNLNKIDCYNGTQANFNSDLNLNFKNKNGLNAVPKKEEKSSAKKEEKYISNAEIPALEAVVSYFIFKLSTETEGNRFFNYYASIDWLIGGKTKMRDWKALARNWIMNQGKYNFKNANTQKASGNPSVENNKNYNEPL